MRELAFSQSRSMDMRPVPVSRVKFENRENDWALGTAQNGAQCAAQCPVPAFAQCPVPTRARRTRANERACTTRARRTRNRGTAKRHAAHFHSAAARASSQSLREAKVAGFESRVARFIVVSSPSARLLNSRQGLSGKVARFESRVTRRILASAPSAALFHSRHDQDRRSCWRNGACSTVSTVTHRLSRAVRSAG